MTQAVLLLTAEALRPEEVRALAESLGAEPSPDPGEPNDSMLQRGDARVWVDTFPPCDLPYTAVELEGYARVLGAPPRGRIILQVSRERGSEWLAAEFVLAALERWALVIEDFGGEVLTGEQFSERLAERAGDLFQPADRYDASSRRVREVWADPVDVLLPGTADVGALAEALRSLGARSSPDEDTDAVLSRGTARVWVSLRTVGQAPVIAARLTVYREVLGDAPYGSARLDVLEGRESQLLAVELVEGLAAKWPLLVQPSGGPLMTIADVRGRVYAGATEIFSP